MSELDLNSRINEVFSGSFARPGRVTVYKEDDPEDYDGEGESVEEFYSNKTWEEINLENAGGYLISYLNPDALLYYLPAMLKELLSTKRKFTDFEERFFSDFGDSRCWNSRMEYVFNQLNNDQKNLIYEVCLEVRKREGHYYLEIQQIEEKFKC